MKKTSSWNEETWVNWLRSQKATHSRGVFVGIGDDCAVVKSATAKAMVLKTDAVVEGVHFNRTMDFALVGRKALARVVSDFAAMGAVPRHALVTVGVPRGEKMSVLQKLYGGIFRCARRWGMTVVGGETTRSRDLWLSVSAWGEASAWAQRSGAKAGDILLVTGKLGGSFPKRHLTFEPRLKEGQWLVREKYATAMMDISDGLGKDLPRLAAAGGLAYDLMTERVPRQRGCSLRQAINDGEDYELLFSVAPQKLPQLMKRWPFRVALTPIGALLPAGRGHSSAGAEMKGFDHFA